MGYWKTKGLRGSELEEMINATNDLYQRDGVALIQKIPTPITPVELDNEKRVIKLAYFEKKSTVDYIGVAQGIPICFDAKETLNKSMPHANIHDHQVEYMKSFIEQKGVSFFIFYFKTFEKCFLVPIEKYIELYDKTIKEGKKSIPISYFTNEYEIEIKKGMYINYLDKLNYFL